jgi:uncharacterized protein YndB with AHSA1/START domain
MGAMTGKRATVTTPTDTQIQIVREFDAPKHLVWRAYTEPDLIRQWWHAKRGEVTSIEVDLRVGGRWRYAMVATGGFEVAFHGEYREIVPTERLVSTEVYEGAPDHPALTEITFTEQDGVTTLTLVQNHDSKISRDMTIESGMEDGLQDALDLLETLTQSLA